MSLSGGIAALATKIGNHIRDSVIPRLVPVGGVTGQALVKKTGNSNDLEWRHIASVPFYFSAKRGNLSAGQQTFTIPGGYTPGTVAVVMAGIDLYENEFVATNGTTVEVTGYPVDADDKIKILVGLGAPATTTDWASITGTPAFGSAATRNAGTAPGNVPIIDSSSKLPASLMPNLAINDVFTVASEAAMLALTAERGDVAIRSDTTAAFTTYILAADDATKLASWVGIPLPASVVKMVAGLSGPTITVTQLLDALGTTGAAQLWANTAAKLLSVNHLWAAQAYTQLTWAATLPIDASTGLNFKVTLAGATTITFTGMKPGQSGVLKLTQNGTGGYGVTWGSGVNVGAGAPVLNTTAGKNTWISFFYDADLNQTVVGLFSKDA